MRTTAVRTIRALPGPEARAVIRTVSSSGIAWFAGEGTGAALGANRASAAATTGSIVAGFGSGGPNNVRCGRRAASSRRHAEHSAQFVEGLERRPRRAVIEPRRTILRQHRVLRPRNAPRADPLAERGRQAMGRIGIAADDVQQCLD